MKESGKFLAAAVMELMAIGAWALPLPIQNGVLTRDLNANGQGVTNVGSITFADGTVQGTAGGGGAWALGIAVIGSNGAPAAMMLGLDASGRSTTNAVPTSSGSTSSNNFVGMLNAGQVYGISNVVGSAAYATNAGFAGIAGNITGQSVLAVQQAVALGIDGLQGPNNPGYLYVGDPDDSGMLGMFYGTQAGQYERVLQGNYAGSILISGNGAGITNVAIANLVGAWPATLLTNNESANVTFPNLFIGNQLTSSSGLWQINENGTAKFAQNGGLGLTIDASGNIAAQVFTGNGSGMTNLAAAALTGTEPLAVVNPNVVTNNEAGATVISQFGIRTTNNDALVFNVNEGVPGAPYGWAFFVSSNGVQIAGLMNIPGANITGTIPAAATTNAPGFWTAAPSSGGGGLTATNTATTGQVVQFNGGTNVWAGVINSNVVYASAGVVSQPWVPTNCLLRSDGLWFTNCWIGAAITNTITCTNAGFTSGMVGKQILVQSAFTAQQDNSLYVECLFATVTNVPNGNQVQFSTATSLASSLTTPYQTSVFIATDDSTNLQNLIYWCYTNNIHRIVFSRATGIGGALQDTNNWNSLIRLPTVAGFIDSFVFKFEGDNGPDEGASVGLAGDGQPFNTPTTLGAWIVVMNPGGTNSYLAANTSLYQSFLCCGTNGVTGTSDGFNNVTPVFENIGIRMPGNARLGGIEAKYCNSIKLYNVTLDDGWGSFAGPDLSMDTHNFGIETPNNGNNACGGDIIQSSRIVGFYVDLIAYEHVFLNDVALFNCVFGAQVAGYHGITMIHPRFQSYLYGIQSEGTTSLTLIDADFEHDKYPAWYTTYNDDIDDQQNRMSGMIEYTVYNSGAGSAANYTNLVVKGGLNLIKIPAVWNQPYRNAFTASAVGQYYTNYPGNGNMMLTANFANESTPGWYGGSTNLPTFGQWSTNLPAVSGFMAIPSNPNAPLSNDFVNCFGNIGANSTVTNVIGPVTTGAHVMWYWTTNGATIYAGETAP